MGIIRRNLKPFDDFKRELTQRDSNDLSPIHDETYPEELLPTIEEMNRLFERISESQQEQNSSWPMLRTSCARQSRH